MSAGLSAVLRCVCAPVFTRVSIQKKNIDTNDTKNALPKLSAKVKLFA